MLACLPLLLSAVGSLSKQTTIFISPRFLFYDTKQTLKYMTKLSYISNTCFYFDNLQRNI